MFLEVEKGKTRAATRTIAVVHPAVLRVLKRRLANKPRNAQLFEELSSGGRDRKQSAAATEAFGRYRRACGVPDGPDFHSSYLPANCSCIPSTPTLVPKRTNEFQSVIYAIQLQLAGVAKVSESQELIDRRDGKAVEVDIVVETEHDSIPVVLGFECNAKKRPATREWVNEMAAKHAHLPIDKTVLVSKAGFTKSALTVAKACDLEALTPQQVEQQDWPRKLDDLRDIRIAGIHVEVNGWKAQCVRDPQIPISAQVSGEARYHEKPEDSGIPIKVLIEGLADGHKLGQLVFASWKQRGGAAMSVNATFEWTPPQGGTLEVSDGVRLPLKHLVVDCKVTITDQPVKFQPLSVQSKGFFQGTVTNVFPAQDMRLVLIAPAEPTSVGTVMVFDDKGNRTKMIDGPITLPERDK